MKGLKPALTISCMILLTGCSSEVRADDFPKWPVRNGDFSTPYQPWGRTAWHFAINSGKHDVRMDPAQPEVINPPAVAVLETTIDGSCYFYQNLPLMKGDYRLGVDVSGTDKAKVRVSFGCGETTVGSELMNVGRNWISVQLDLSAPGGNGTITLNSISPAQQAAKFRKVRVDIMKLASSPVPFEDGSYVGSLVLPDEPTIAEQFACYELQRYIFKITGLVPGLKGRDTVHQGKVIYLGRAANREELGKLRSLLEDSYIVNSQENKIALAGKTDQGTLYAVYDFIRQQGVRWIVPGDLGEIVPQR